MENLGPPMVCMGFESLQNQQARFVTMPEKKGDSIGGYYYYTFNYAKVC